MSVFAAYTDEFGFCSIDLQIVRRKYFFKMYDFGQMHDLNK